MDSTSALPGVRQQDGSKLYCTHQLLVCADDVNILGGSVNDVKKNRESLVVVSKLNTWSFLEIRMQDEVTL